MSHGRRKVRGCDDTGSLDQPTREVGVVEIFSEETNGHRAEKGIHADGAHKIADRLTGGIFSSDANSKRLVHPLRRGRITYVKVVHPCGRELPKRPGSLAGP